ncbi:MAG: D-2-hydroxyacid dehydrogenase [Woeseiaceae bacterium]|nr:D-2-hydroxyacid dehydrogenase [Woeseiaceae bacterium]
MTKRIHCLVVLVLCSLTPAAAQDAIDRLVEQSGVETGATPMREHPGWTTDGKIVIADRHGVADKLRRLHPHADIVPIRSRAEAAAHMADAVALIGYCPPDVPAAAPRLVWTQRYSAGVESCFESAGIRDGDIVLTNMQKMDSPVIAEHVIAMVLALSRGIVPYAKSMESGEWLDDGNIVRGMDSIAGKTLLVAGLGGIGTEVARRAAALDMRVTATRRSAREGPDFVAYVGLADELPALAREADFIVNALPLTPETEGLFDAAFFAGVKPGAYFINVGRGGSVVTDELYAALRSGRLAGAGLDVTEPEPLPGTHPLWQHPDVIITPHVASEGSNWARKETLLLENVRRFLAGEALYNVVDPARGY